MQQAPWVTDHAAQDYSELGRALLCCRCACACVSGGSAWPAVCERAAAPAEGHHFGAEEADVVRAVGGPLDAAPGRGGSPTLHRSAPRGRRVGGERRGGERRGVGEAVRGRRERKAVRGRRAGAPPRGKGEGRRGHLSSTSRTRTPFQTCHGAGEERGEVGGREGCSARAGHASSKGKGVRARAA